MSVRLSVVLCQAAGGSAHRRDLEGDLVAQLIGAPGLDLSLVGAIENLDPGGTDRLLLGGLLGDLAVLTWHSPPAALALCHEAGLAGFRARHSLDEQGEASAPSQVNSAPVLQVAEVNQPSHHSPAGAQATDARRLYFFDLSSHSASTVVAGLQRLLQARRTQTVSISVAGKPVAAPPNQAALANQAAALVAPNPQTAPKSRPATAAFPIAQPVSHIDSAVTSSKRNEEGNRGESEQDDSTSEPRQRPHSRQPLKTSGTTEWDQLVEELNDLDI